MPLKDRPLSGQILPVMRSANYAFGDPKLLTKATGELRGAFYQLLPKADEDGG